VFDVKACLELIVALGLVVAMWIRLERRMTRIEDRVHERYRDKKENNERLKKIENWLPKDKPLS